MELRTLRYFLTTAEQGNITRAADILHITQPTLSRQLMDLERELGTTLLVRGKRSLSLTDDGLFFKQQAEEIIQLADKAEQAFVGKRDTISGVIALGSSEALGTRVLAKYMCSFQKKYPQVHFCLYNEMADNIRDKLEKGLLDLGLLLEPVDTNRYEYLRLSQKETWGVLLRKDHPLAEKNEITVSDLPEYPLLMPRRENAKREVLNWLGKEESQLNVPLDYDLLSNVALLVEEGMGCAICLDGALSIHCSPEICFRPVSPEKTTRSVLLWKKNHLLQPAVSLFIQMIHSRRFD